MGNKSCRICVQTSSPIQCKSGKDRNAYSHVPEVSSRPETSQYTPSTTILTPSNLEHISDRERIENETLTPSDHAKVQSIFIQKCHTEDLERRKSGALNISPSSVSRKRRSSCSTVYIDDSTVSQPNIKASIKCVAFAVYYHIRHPNEKEKLTPEIFDEKTHPLTKEKVPADYDCLVPDHRQIYRFIRTLFNAAQLTAECSIVTLIYVERLLSYAEILICSANWKRILLGTSSHPHLILIF